MVSSKRKKYVNEDRIGSTEIKNRQEKIVSLKLFHNMDTVPILPDEHVIFYQHQTKKYLISAKCTKIKLLK